MLEFCLTIVNLSIIITGLSYVKSQQIQSQVKPFLHPLDPLTAEEILSTRAVILSSPIPLTEKYTFNVLTLQEPPKSLLLPYFLSNTDPPLGIPRKSFSVLVEKKGSRAVEVVVNLDTLETERISVLPKGSLPIIASEEWTRATVIAKNHPVVKKRCRALGYPNMTLVYTYDLAMGYVDDQPKYKNKRLEQIRFYGQNYELDNYIAHPFDFAVIVDVTNGKVIAIEEFPSHDDFNASNKEGTTVPRREANYDYKLLPTGFLRTEDRPIEVDFPEGPSYVVNGNEVQWQKFKMRIGFNAREGLVIYNVNYNDSGTVRPIIYRASLSEMWVPYGDPRPPFHRQNFFDVGKAGLGNSVTILKHIEDCIGAVKFFDVVLPNSAGDAEIHKNAICIEEEDDGILWKHRNFRNGDSVVVRSHRLVIKFIITVENYDYIFHWRFYQDSSIEFSVAATGIVNVHLLALNATQPMYGTTVFPQLHAPYHQHFIMARIDTEIDGNLNSVFTSEIVPVEENEYSKTNPYGQGFTTKRVDLKTASDARTHISPLSSKTWVVTNPNHLNPYTNSPVGWKLIPKNTAPHLQKEDSPVRLNAGFVNYDVWVTPYEDDKLFAAGYYINNDGLPEWVQNAPDANVENTDIVLWHNFGLTHIPRVEDFPVMPTESTGFWFKPFNFFNQNPGLDVPPPRDNLDRTEL